jgi:hypothetical protein
VALGVLAPLFASRIASAQEWLKDRRYQEGPGYRTGDLEIHPGLGGEIGYDSNWFLRSDKTNGPINGCPGACPQGSPVMRITPSLNLSTLSPQRREGDVNVEPPSINFRAGLSATYREFFGQLSPEQRNVSGKADTRLEILPQRPWGAAIFANYERTIQPSVFSNPDLAFNRDDVGAGGEIVAQPGGGTLDWHLGYQFHDTIFEDTGGTPYQNITHEAFTRGRWKFRPRTALLFDATQRFISYSNATCGTNGQLTCLHDSTPLRARLGLNGLVTPRFALLAMAGYGGSFYINNRGASPKQYDSIIGQVELKFFLTAVPGDEKGASLSLSSLALGYTRDFQNSYLADFYGSDRGYLKFSYFFAGRALVSVEGGAGAIEYPTAPLLGQPNGWTDVRLDATLFGEYRFTDSLGVNLTGRYTSNISNTELSIVAPGAGGPQLYAMQWQRFEGYLGFRWLM